MKNKLRSLKRYPLLFSSIWVLLLIVGVAVISANHQASPDARTLQPEQETSLKGVPQLILNTKSAGAGFETRQLFQAQSARVSTDAALERALNDGVVLYPKHESMQRLLNEDVPFLTLPLPDGQGGTLELELVKVNIFAPGFTVNLASNGHQVTGHLGAHYRGIVKGDTTSLAAISVFENEVMGFYSTREEGNYVLGRLTGDNPTNRHILYNDKDLKGKSDFSCDTEDHVDVLPKSNLPAPREGDSPAVICVRMYFETDYSLYTNKGSVANVRNYMTGLFNQTATLYANDTIPVAMSQLVIWDVPSPYVPTSSTTMLNGFKARRTVYNGDTAHLVSLNVPGSGLASVDTLCGNDSYAFSGILPDYQNVPAFSVSVLVMTHEAGHSLASPHTHSCFWNGNNTAIDGCAPVEDGNCAQPGIPAGGGTIMSYCHNQAVGTNFANGFGPQPKAWIIQRVGEAFCLRDCALPATPKRAFDFDGDGRADVSVFRNSGGIWHLLRSTAGYTGAAFGLATDRLAPADYDGDGRTDLAVYRDGTWYLQRSSTGFKGVSFGTTGDYPRPGDYDGDGLADISVFRPSNGGWYRLNSGDGTPSSVAFGQAGDAPLIGDFDGDGKADQAVFRPSNSSWYMLRSQLGFTGVQFGIAGDVPVPADYDGDGKTDIAVWRPSTASWYILRSNLGFTGAQFGINVDVPVPADYDGDGRADIAVYRSGAWYIQGSTAGFSSYAFGINNDRTVPGAYLPPFAEGRQAAIDDDKPSLRRAYDLR